MSSYTIRKMTEPLPDLYGTVFEPEEEPFCQSADVADLDCYTWDIGNYCPEAHAYVTWSNVGLHVLMAAKEKEIVTEHRSFGDEVYKDSCLEFFLQPFADDKRYLNIEVNAAGAALIGFGEGRAERIRFERAPEGMNLCASRHRGAWWAVAYTIPAAWLRALYGRTPRPGDAMRGNFYKCEETNHVHFGSWAPVIHFQPDFHRPEWFGRLILEA